MSAAHPVEGLRVSVVLVGERCRLFAPIVFLEKMDCECHFAESNRELRDLLPQTKLDIVLSLNTHYRLLELVSLLGGFPVNMFHLLQVEEGGWWLPVLREGQDCLGTHAVRTKEFSKVLTVMVKDIRMARSTVAKLSAADEYGDRKHPPIAARKSVSALKIIPTPQRSEPFVEARRT